MNLLHAMTVVAALVQGDDGIQPSGPDEPGGPPAVAEYDGSAGQIRIGTPRVPSVEVSVDGYLDEPVWARSALLSGFTQYDPAEGAPASQRTEVSVFAGPDALYFGIRAYDDNPGRIRATLAQRDEIQESDDYVRIILDTFNDQRRAYVFTVNPLGVQHDGLWVEGREGRRGGGFGDPIDGNQDFVWDSSGRVEAWGYTVELRIPFKSLRFRRDPEQEWGLQVVRNIRRFGYNESWAPITADRSNKLTQAGKLLDLSNLDPGLFLEINPEVTGRRTGLEDDDGQFVRESAEGDVGVNVTYGVTPNLRFDATYNPDFSQVEADAGQIAVNERFALFFDEKRPFFLEGTEIFSLPMQLVYTRTIANPLGGAKLTGKAGGFDVGYLGAIDRYYNDDLDEQAFVNLVRVRRDVGESSNVGLIYTDRTAGRDLYNRVAGADARFVLARRYTVQVMGSGSVTGDAPGSTLTGGLYRASVQRSGRSLTFEAGLEGTTPDFRAESGFLRRIGDAQMSGQIRYNWWGSPGAFLERFGPSLEMRGYWDHDALWAGQGMKEADVQARWSTSFRGNYSLWATASTQYYDFTPDKYEGLFVGDPDGTGSATPFYPDQSLFRPMPGLRLFLFIGGVGPLQGRVGTEWKETPIFDSDLGVPVAPADAWSAEVGMTLRPTRSLAVSLDLNHLVLNRKDGSRYSTATIPRIRLQYQLSRAWYVRTIAEYGAQERGDLLDPATGQPIYGCTELDGCELREASEDNGLYGDVLLGYEPSPGTVFYVGYSRQMRDRDTFGFSSLDPVADGLFAKVSYRFRF